MAQQFYIITVRGEVGPVDRQAMIGLLRDGAIQSQDQVRTAFGRMLGPVGEIVNRSESPDRQPAGRTSVRAKLHPPAPPSTRLPVKFGLVGLAALGVITAFIFALGSGKTPSGPPAKEPLEPSSQVQSTSPPRPTTSPHPPTSVPQPPLTRPASKTVNDPSEPGITPTVVFINGARQDVARFQAEAIFHLPADSPFSLRVEPVAGLAATRFWCNERPIMEGRNARIESVIPYYAWGDDNSRPNLHVLPAGTHTLRIGFYKDARALEQLRPPLTMTIIVAAP